MTVRDAQRHTTKLQLRLPPDVAREIRALAASSGVQVSTLVALAWAVARRSGVIEALISALKAAEAAAWNSPTAKNRRRVLNYRRALARRPVTVVPSSGARW